MRISKFDQEFVGDKPFAITVKDYDQEKAPTAKIELSRYCIRNMSELKAGTPEQKAYFAKNRTQILQGNDPDWRLATVEVMEDSSVVLQFYSRSARERLAVQLNNRSGFHFEVKVIPQDSPAVTESYSITLDSRNELPHPHLMILYGYQCKMELLEVKDNRSRLVPTMISCLA